MSPEPRERLRHWRCPGAHGRVYSETAGGMDMAQQGRSPGALVLGSDFRALGVVRSLGRRGVPCALVDSVPRAAWFSRYVGVRARWSGSMLDAGLCDLLLDLARRRRLDGWVVFPMQDDTVELVARHRDRLGRVFRVPTPCWPV